MPLFYSTHHHQFIYLKTESKYLFKFYSVVGTMLASSYLSWFKAWSSSPKSVSPELLIAQIYLHTSSCLWCFSFLVPIFSLRKFNLCISQHLFFSLKKIWHYESHFKNVLIFFVVLLFLFFLNQFAFVNYSPL